MVEMEERRKKLVVLLGLYVLVKNVVGIQTLIWQGEWEICNFERGLRKHWT